MTIIIKNGQHHLILSFSRFPAITNMYQRHTAKAARENVMLKLKAQEPNPNADLHHGDIKLYYFQ